MFGFVKQTFLSRNVSSFVFGFNLSSINPLECFSINNQECKIRHEIFNVNSNEPVFYPFSIKTSKSNGSCNNINDSYAKLCVSDVAKNINIKVFSLMSRTNERRHVKLHEACKCKFILVVSVCDGKERCNNDKYKCECKEFIDNGISNKIFIWNLSNCERDCDKLCDVGEYLDYENCKRRKILADKLIKKFTENIDEVKIVEMALV